ncbi:MAG: hypothetical protein K8Q89_08385 [Nitrosarchaeum sp.]|nr:hypothetical protein [Nitrosarchaeum sp.]
MNRKSENIPAYLSLSIYTIVGAVLRYFIIPFCVHGLENLTVALGYATIPFIIIGIGFGLYSFLFPNRKRTRIAIGVVTGLSVGFGGMTVYALASNSCI